MSEQLTTFKISTFRMVLFFIIFITVSVIQGVATSGSTPLMHVSRDDSKLNRYRTVASDTEIRKLSISKEERKEKDSKREMIGSAAATRTFNECRGCKCKCRAEEVPVEGNDPMNSPYHYKRVCHT